MGQCTAESGRHSSSLESDTSSAKFCNYSLSSELAQAAVRCVFRTSEITE